MPEAISTSNLVALSIYGQDLGTGAFLSLKWWVSDSRTTIGLANYLKILKNSQYWPNLLICYKKYMYCCGENSPNYIFTAYNFFLYYSERNAVSTRWKG